MEEALPFLIGGDDTAQELDGDDIVVKDKMFGPVDAAIRAMADQAENAIFADVFVDVAIGSGCHRLPPSY